LRRRFGLDEEYLEDLKVEIIQAKQLATDEDNTILAWTGDTTPQSNEARLAALHLRSMCSTITPGGVTSSL
jgi:hypothetical protein